jgi:RimJ/RimL family protein N-acetyltransferase
MTAYAPRLETVDADLHLQLVQPDDAQALYDLVADPVNNAHLGRFEPWAEGYTLEQAQAQTTRVSERMSRGDDAIMQYMAVWSADGSPEGRMAGCYTLFGHIGESALLGYWQAFAACGKGFATHSARRLIEYAQEVWGLKTVVLNIADDNTPSQAVARRLSAVPTDEMVHFETYGRPRDERVWRIVLPN